MFKYADGVGLGSRLGEMAEWFKAAVLKTVVGLHPTGGSNPSLSVGPKDRLQLAAEVTV